VTPAALLAAHPGWGWLLLVAVTLALVSRVPARAVPPVGWRAACAFALLTLVLGGVLAWQTANAPALLAQAGPAWRAAAAIVSHAGDPPLLWALCLGVGLTLWGRGARRLALAWAGALAGNGLTVRALKPLFDTARPVDAEALVGVAGASFPSGHASGALVAWGLLGAIALAHAPSPGRARAVFVACALLATSVGYSRWVLGAHHLSDVLAGWLCGAVWLVAGLAAFRQGRRR
jgi:membrane-associated phospholipid phosphatase